MNKRNSFKASEWGLTDTNYKQLQDLFSKYKDKGFKILAFPSNQVKNFLANLIEFFKILIFQVYESSKWMSLVSRNYVNM
jgi:glutathione peroxidase-family protein